MSLHEQSVGATDEWYTPPYVFEALGCHFDTDVASPGHHIVPWVPANAHIMSGSLEKSWSKTGFIWMNAPFGARNGLVPWLDKFFDHGDGIALTPDRTSAPWWQDAAARSDAVLFVAPKIKFLGPGGFVGGSPAQGTSLLALGIRGTTALKRASGVLGLVMRR